MMNGWLRVALYSFIGIIIGTLLLGLIGSNDGMNNGYYQTYGGYYDNGHRGMGGMMKMMPHGIRMRMIGG